MRTPFELYRKKMEKAANRYPAGSQDRACIDAVLENIDTVSGRRESRMKRCMDYVTSDMIVYTLRKINRTFLTAYDAPLEKPKKEYLN